jgi:hypothetical protein
MTALCQNKRGTLFDVPEAAADEASGKVMPRDILRHAYFHNVPQPAGLEDLLHLAVERRVPKHVADHYLASVPSGSFGNIESLFTTWSDGLLQKHVVTVLEQSNGRRMVQMIAGGINDAAGHSPMGSSFPPGLKSPLRWDTETIGEIVPSLVIRLSDRDRSEFRITGRRVIHVLQSTDAGANKHAGQFGHRFASCNG